MSYCCILLWIFYIGYCQSDTPECEACDSVPNAGGQQWEKCSEGTGCKDCTPCWLWNDDSEQQQIQNSHPTGDGLCDTDCCSKVDFDGDKELCLKPPCTAKTGRKFCPTDECSGCMPCESQDEEKPQQCKIENKCKDEKGLSCVFEDCCPEIGWEFCNGDCEGCKLCDKSTDCNKSTCFGKGGRCIKKTDCISLIGNDDGADKKWQEIFHKFLINDYVATFEKDQIKQVEGNDVGDYWEDRCDPDDVANSIVCAHCKSNATPKRKREILDDWVNRIVCDKCKNENTALKKLKCIWEEVVKRTDKYGKDCACVEHACIVYYILTKGDWTKEFQGKIKNKEGKVVDITNIQSGTLKGDVIGHNWVCIELKEDIIYIDTGNELYWKREKCCPKPKGAEKTPAPTTKTPTTKSPTIEASTVPYKGKYAKRPTCLLTDGCDELDCIIHYVDIAKSMDEAQQYCMDTYGTDLATINTRSQFVKALYFLKGNKAWIGLRNTHKSGWFKHMDNTECIDKYSGECVDASLWKDGHPQKTCEQHPGSWCVALYQGDDNGAYIDNKEYCDVEMSFFCNCEQIVDPQSLLDDCSCEDE